MQKKSRTITFHARVPLSCPSASQKGMNLEKTAVGRILKKY
jgi:hypothetical protein